MQHCGTLKSECESDWFSFRNKQNDLRKTPILMFCVTKAQKGSVVRTTFIWILKCFKCGIFHMQLMLQINTKWWDADIL